MTLSNEQRNVASELIADLDNDRSLLLEQIDNGKWPELRLELADLERELGQLLSRAADEIQEANDRDL